MTLPWIDNQLPELAKRGYAVTSPPAGYNCVAWAASDNTRWWQNEPGFYWPVADRRPQVDSLMAAFRQLGYEDCGDDGSLEPGYEKVAVYAESGLWTHASRQLPEGRWTSKLGPDEDIEHAAPEDLVGTPYGDIHGFMKRTRS